MIDNIHKYTLIFYLIVIFVLPAFAGKTHKDLFVLLLFVLVVCHESRLTCCSNFHSALMDFNQSWVIDATWEPSFVDEVKGHVEVALFARLKSNWNQTVNTKWDPLLCS